MLRYIIWQHSTTEHSLWKTKIRNYLGCLEFEMTLSVNWVKNNYNFLKKLEPRKKSNKKENDEETCYEFCAVFLYDTDLFLLFHLSLVLRSQVFSYLCLSTNNLEYSNF